MSYFTSVKTNTLINDIVLLLVRVFVGFAMLSHGYPKLQMLLSGEPIHFVDVFGMGEKTSLIITVFAEFVCSIFLILGLFSRWAALFILIVMAVAALYVHRADPFDKRELSLLYFSIYLLLFAFGAGKFSVDGMISKRKSDNRW